MAKILQENDHLGNIIPGVFMFECPGCGCYHDLHTQEANRVGAKWGFNGNMDKPTFTPSLLMRFEIGEKSNICHSYITDGKIQFLNDCTHELSGQTVDMIEMDQEISFE